MLKLEDLVIGQPVYVQSSFNPIAGQGIFVGTVIDVSLITVKVSNETKPDDMPQSSIVYPVELELMENLLC